MTALDVFDWLELTPIGVVIRESTWLFPVIEAGHLLGLALLGGSVLIVDLRMMGLGLNGRPIDYVLDQARPFFRLALLTMFATGVPMFLSEAVKCYYSDAFWLKMIGLTWVLGFTIAVRDRVARKPASLASWTTRLVGLTSTASWLVVAAAGRWIGFS